jgi:hypothetical protein
MLISKKREEKNKQKPKIVTLGVQQRHMTAKFPGFSFYKISCSNLGWTGQLKPQEDSPVYTVKIEYDVDHPRVYVIKPKILDNAPHRYDDGRLCLYYPKDMSFDETSLISDTIVPWTAVWLYYYEIWLKEGVWWGPEAPHLPQSSTGYRIERHFS